MENYTVYCHTNKANGKKYIGITRQSTTRRWQNGLGYKDQRVFGQAIQKYGWDNFIHEVLFDGLSKEEAEEKEIELIAKYSTLSHDNGYNIQSGGGLGAIPSNETRDIWSKQRTGVFPSDETREKLRKAQKKRWSDQELRRRVSNIHKLRWSKLDIAEYSGANNHKSKSVICYETGEIFGGVREAARKTGYDNSFIARCCREGKTCHGNHYFYLSDIAGLTDEEIRLKFNNYTHPKGKDVHNSRMVAQIDSNTKEVIRVFSTIQEAAESLHCGHQNIIKVCKGERKTCAGSSWMYAEEVIE